MKLTIIFLLLFPVLINAQNMLTEANWRIYSVKDGKEVTLDDIANEMKNYDVLFFGEEHNDSVTHYLQIELFKKLHSKYGNNLALSLEMFDRDVQEVMNEYLNGYIRERNFTKDARAWSNYKDYRPMVEFAKEKSLNVVCANAPGRYTNMAGREGQEALKKISKKSKAHFAPLPYETASGKYLEKLKGVSHAPAAPVSDTSAAKTPPPQPPPPPSMGNFSLATAQSLWDATMAYSIAQYHKKNKSKKVMHVNGRFHSDEGFAVVAQLRKYSPKAKSLIISSASDKSFPEIDWAKHRKNGDYIIITDPVVPKSY